MNKITFTKISENHYLASNVEWLFEKCRDILVELSDNDLDKFEVSTNNRLFYSYISLISRIYKLLNPAYSILSTLGMLID